MPEPGFTPLSEVSVFLPLLSLSVQSSPLLSTIPRMRRFKISPSGAEGKGARQIGKIKSGSIQDKYSNLTLSPRKHTETGGGG